MEPLLVGFGYKKQSGKDTLAEMVQSALIQSGTPTCTYAIAKPLKDLVQAVYPVPREYVYGGDREKEMPSGVGDLTVRQLLQDFGCQMRTHFPGIWANALKHKTFYAPMLDPNNWPNAVRAKVVLVTDVRFKDEADLIRDRGGYLVKVERPGGLVDNHKSEHQLADYPFDAVAYNSGDLNHLRSVARMLSQRIRTRLAEREVRDGN